MLPIGTLLIDYATKYVQGKNKREEKELGTSCPYTDRWVSVDGQVGVRTSVLTRTDPLSLMKADPSDARFVG